MFEIKDAITLRSMDLDMLHEYKEQLVENRGAIEAAEFARAAQEIKAEIDCRNLESEIRSADIKAVNSGLGKTFERTDDAPIVVDEYDTAEYRNAFMNFVCRGVAIPEGIVTRSDASTTTGDIPVMIPTTLMNQIIEKLENYGEIYAGVTKLNVKGGIEFPVMELNPTANWVGEEVISDYQELTANLKVTFGYYELECRLSQSWLASIVSFDEFQRRFVPAATKAMIKALDAAIISGSGSGQPLGIINDSRITKEVSLTSSEIVDWKKWRSKVKHAIPSEYRNGGVWIMNQGTWDAYIETMADDGNSPVSIGYNPVTGNEEMRLMGSRVLITSQLPEYDDAEDEEVFCIYGRLSDYAINSNQQLMTQQWNDPADRKQKTLAYMVCDGKVLDPYGWVLVTKESADSLNLTVAARTSTTYGVAVSSLQSDLTIGDGSITGTSKYYDGSGWSAGTWAEAEKAGNFICVDVSADSGCTMTAELRGGLHPGKTTLSSNSDYLCIKISDAASQKLILEATKDGVKQQEIFDFNGLVCQSA